MQQNSKIYIELDRDELITEAINLTAEATKPVVNPGFWTEDSKAEARVHVENDWPKERLAALIVDGASESLAAKLVMDVVRGIVEASK
ncbi:hypothetical protein [Lacticaseibacillus porcinae]|uniref:hypothetical protein n=1 Tax=Lacticaseibacillus porcinae TaxID=1123687 RepID=UPI000F7A7A7C|nr:hypothetical protein [Lacticaseibacillus porcinae]